MRETFRFPAFETLQLGPRGSSRYGECGCVISKINEIRYEADLTADEAWDLQQKTFNLLRESVGNPHPITGYDAINSLANRRKAYDALCRATDEVLGVEDA